MCHNDDSCDDGDHGVPINHERSVHELHHFNELRLSVPRHVPSSLPVSVSGCRSKVRDAETLPVPREGAPWLGSLRPRQEVGQEVV